MARPIGGVFIVCIVPALGVLEVLLNNESDPMPPSELKLVPGEPYLAPGHLQSHTRLY